MRIGEVNKENYATFIKMFGGKGTKVLDEMWGKDKATNAAKTNQGKWVNPYAEPGMDITGMTEADFKIVKVSDDIREKIVNLARKEFLDNYGRSDGEELSSIMKKYIKSVPASERVNVGWTLNQIYLDEARRLHSAVKEVFPGWQDGKPFDRNAVNDVISRARIDLKA